MNTNNI